MVEGATALAARVVRKEDAFLTKLKTAAAIIASSPMAVISADLDGTITSWNPAAERLYGYRAHEATGQNVRLIVPEALQHEIPPVLAAVARGETVRLSDQVRRAANGDLRLVDVVACPVFDAVGRVDGVATTARDVTHERELEEHVRRLAKLEALGELAAGIAHDFNNWLVVIGGYTAIARSTADAGKREAALAEVAEAAGAAANLTRRLLRVARVDEARPEPLDLQRELLSLAGAVQCLVGTRVQVQIDADDLGAASMDPTHLQQVIVNLAANARDAMPDGGRLTVTARRAPDGELVLSVSDTGTGMDSATKSRVFEPFFTTKGPERGTGLGLATVYGIVAGYGGTVEVESAPGKGSTFTLVLPRAAA